MAHILNDSSDEETTDWMFEGVDYLRKGDEVLNTDYELIGTVINGKIDFVNDDARDYHLGEKDESDEELDDNLELPETREISTQTDVSAVGSGRHQEFCDWYETRFAELIETNKRIIFEQDKPESDEDENVRDLQTKLNALQDAHDSLQATHDEVVEKHAGAVRTLKQLAENPPILDKPEEIEDKPKPKKAKKKVATRKKVALDPDDYDDTHDYRKARIMNLSIKAGKSLCKGIDDLNWIGVGNHPDGARQGLRERIWNYYEANVSGMDGQNQRWADDFEEHC